MTPGAPLALPRAEVLAEVPTASDWCRRWTSRTPSWKHRSAGGFDSRQYEVHPVDEPTARAFVLTHHYSASYPVDRFRFGLYRASAVGPRLCGVAVFGVPVSSKVLLLPFPELRPVSESLECSRFVLTDEAPGNSESWFLARCHEELLQQGIHGTVSFADPVPKRDISGKLIAIGHIGVIYQASNAAYLGRATPRTVKLLPDGTVFNERTAQKIRRQEQGHEYATAKLVALGAPPLRTGTDPALWLRAALVAVGARSSRHRGVHRYVFRLGANRRARESIRLGMPELATYPKQADPVTL